jgi:hypothetical protein
MKQTNIALVDGQDVQSTRPDIFDDRETRSTVSGQRKLEKSVTLGLFVVAMIRGLVNFKGGVDSGIVSTIIMFLVFVGVSWLVNLTIFTPMRAVRFGACVNRMSDWANRALTVARYNTWKSPVPSFLAIDTGRKLLFVEGPTTDFYGLILRGQQIVDVKVEREQHIETTTKHSGRFIYGGALRGGFGIGRLGGGTSKSKSKVVEQAFLEIVFSVSRDGTPSRIVFNFGEARRAADDWVLMIGQMRNAV